MIRNQIYLEKKQLNKLKELSYNNNKNVSQIIREIINKELFKDIKSKQSGQWALSIAKEAQKKNIKAPKDLASNTDEYLYK